MPGDRSTWLLTIEDDEGAVSHHRLSGERCTVGRASDRDVVLAQANISRRHARFERRGEGWQLVDEGSDNGSFVNGCAVGPGPASVGVNDTLQLGDYRLALSIGEPVRALPPPPAPLTPARLRVIAGLSVGAEFAIERHDFVTIGSAADCSFRLVHESIAPLHATVRTLPGGRFELRDRSQTGLLFVNGHPVIGEHVLEGGDAINVGGVVLLRFLEPSQWPDPRFDMVSNPDSWLSVDLAPADERPTLDERPEVDDLSGPNEPVVVVELPVSESAFEAARQGAASEQAAAAGGAGGAGRAAGSGGPGAAARPAGAPGEDESLPVSSRRKMLATLRRLASW